MDDTNSEEEIVEETGGDDGQVGSDMDDSSEGDSNEDNSSLGVPIFETPSQVPPPIKRAEAPPEGMTWNDDAILECFRLAVNSHKDSNPAQFSWSAPCDVNATPAREDSSDNSWKPKSLSLPLWAVDPFAKILGSGRPSDEASGGGGRPPEAPLDD